MQVGRARGWNVWPLQARDWAWRAWDHLQSRSGVQTGELAAEQAAQEALAHIVAEAEAADPERREVPEPDTRGDGWHPQA